MNHVNHVMEKVLKEILIVLNVLKVILKQKIQILIV